MAALIVFFVRHGAIRIKVRVLPTVQDVHREYLESPQKTRKRFGRGKTVHAFSAPTNHAAAKHTATIVLPSNGRLEELIPHEVFHAVMDKFGCVHRGDDEAAATAIGILSARIARKISRGVTYE